jgi:dTMP kinase
LLDPANRGITPLVETLLYMASRAQLVEEVIKPKLRQGKIVLCDRWLDATVAYQGYGGGVDVRWIQALGEPVTQGVSPRLSIFLDLPLEAGLRRARSHKAADRMERKRLSYHQKVRRGYTAIAKAEPVRFRIVKIKESDPIRTVHEKILEAVRRVLG